MSTRTRARRARPGSARSSGLASSVQCHREGTAAHAHSAHAACRAAVRPSPETGEDQHLPLRRGFLPAGRANTSSTGSYVAGTLFCAEYLGDGGIGLPFRGDHVILILLRGGPHSLETDG